MAIFDRSWYLRVLDERVEGLVPAAVWQDAYRDIVDFERMLADDGTVIVKFFLHISHKEQRRRFEAMEADPLESWRVTQEDWARLKRYGDYLEAAEDMLEQTESGVAPWTIVEAHSRWYARRRIFETLIHALEERLGDHAPPAETNGRRKDKDSELREAMDRLEKEGAHA